MNKIKTIIIDDEQFAREDIKNQLGNFSEIELAGEADNLDEAKQLYKKLRPDLIFLDIQLGNHTGFDLFEELDENTKVIFVTAFDEYAIKAFEVNAFDYLLKPVVYERLRKTIDRLFSEDENVAELKKEQLSIEDNIFLKVDRNYQFIKIGSIQALTSADDYSELYLSENSKKHLVSKSLKDWEERLPEKQFCRIHRSTIININFIEKIEPWHNYSQKVFIKGIEKPFLMSRRYFSIIKNLLG